MLAVRIVTADYYMSSPLPGLDVCYSEFRQAEVTRVPVVRIFGPTPAGQKTCLHLHGTFPYFYVPYDGCEQQPERHLRQLAFSIDRALNVSLGNPSSSVQHVFRVSLVSGMPFYGFHEKEKQFMKIYLYNPLMVKRVCELLQGGAVMNKSYQPYEAHLPYLLQLFIDHNLYGMNLIHLAAVKFRKTRRKSDQLGRGSPEKPISELCNASSRENGKSWKSPLSIKSKGSPTQMEKSMNCSFVRWEEEDIPSSLVLEDIDRQSTCELEVDAVAADILNRAEIEAQVGRNPGLQAIWDDEKQRRRENNMSSQIESSNSPDRGSVQVTESERTFQRRIKEILQQNNYSVYLSQYLENEEFETLTSNLTLHMTASSPEAISCTPANLVEIHNDKQGVSQGNAETEEAIVDEETILNIMDNSQTFHPSSQRLIQNPILNASQDQAMVHLLAGLEEDEYGMARTPFVPGRSSHQQPSGNHSYQQNSDDEENEPEVQKEELELSLIMSQRWDGDLLDPVRKMRFSEKNASDCSSEEDNAFSDGQIGNGNMMANLSIPQLDGAADENTDNTLGENGSRTHSTLAVRDKVLTKTTFHKEPAILELPSSDHVGLQCNRAGTTLHTLDGLNSTELPSYQNTFIKAKKPEHSVSNFSNEATYDLKHSGCSEDSMKFVDPDMVARSPDAVCETKHVSGDYENQLTAQTDRLQRVKRFLSINCEKNLPFTHLRSPTNEGEFHGNSNLSSIVGRMANKVPLAFNKKENSVYDKPLIPLIGIKNGVQLFEEHKTTSTDAGNNIEQNLKIRYEDFQATQREKTVIDQHEAQYTFFPSVVLPNCLKCPEKVFKSSKIQKQDDHRLKLKLSRKKSNGAQVTRKSAVPKINAQATEFSCSSGLLQNKVPMDHNSVQSLDTGLPIASQNFNMARSSENGLEGQSFRLACSKYTLRTKRKVSYEAEDTELIQGTEILKTSPIRPECSKVNDNGADRSQRSRKRRRLNKKEPPVIIKYIIINRFKGRKNMLVKVGKVDSNEDHVVLDDDKLQKYHKLSPLKDWWPKITEPPFVSKPFTAPTPKRGKKPKVQASLKKRAGRFKKLQRKEKLKHTSQSQVKTRKIEFAPLSPPSPCYSAEADDCSTEYKDVMSKLGFMSERMPSPPKPSPPRCWSPSEMQEDGMPTFASVEDDILVRDCDPCALRNSDEKNLVQGNRNSDKKQCLKTRKKSPCNANYAAAKKTKVSQKSKQVVNNEKEEQKGKHRKKTRKRWTRKQKSKVPHFEKQATSQSSELHEQMGSCELVNGELNSSSKEKVGSGFCRDFENVLVAESEPAGKSDEQPSIPLSICSTGHLPSTQPYSEEIQGESGGYYCSLLETDENADLPAFTYPPVEQVSDTLSQLATPSQSQLHFNLSKTSPSCTHTDSIYMLENKTPMKENFRLSMDTNLASQAGFALSQSEHCFDQLTAASAVPPSSQSLQYSHLPVHSSEDVCGLQRNKLSQQVSQVMSHVQTGSQHSSHVKETQIGANSHFYESEQKSALPQLALVADGKANHPSQQLQQSKLYQQSKPTLPMPETNQHSTFSPVNNATGLPSRVPLVGSGKDVHCLNFTPGNHSRLSKKVFEREQETSNILDISDFTPPRIKQKSVSETFLETNIISQSQKSDQSVIMDSQTSMSNGQSSLTVLREMLQKRQQKAQQGNAQSPLPKPQFQRNISLTNEQNEFNRSSADADLSGSAAAAHSKSPKDTCSKKTKNSRSAKHGQKKTKTTKRELTKKSQTSQSKCPFSDDSPVFHSDAGFDSCYSFDSLSPELPQSYNFDINTVGQTRYCTVYSGCQFMPAAEQNLPQKFLSDVIQESVPAQAIIETCVYKSQNGKPQHLDQVTRPTESTEWARPGSISPDLFEKSSLDNGEKLKELNNDSNVPVQNALSSSSESSGTHLSGVSIMELKDQSPIQCHDSLENETSCSPIVSSTSQIMLLDEGSGRECDKSEVCLSGLSTGSSPNGAMGFIGDDIAPMSCEDPELCASKYSNGSPATSHGSSASVSSPLQTRSNCYINRTTGAHVLKPLMSPPSREEIVATLLDHNLAETVYQEPFCSDPSDAPEKPWEIGGRVLTVETRLPNELSEFDGDFSLEGLQFWKMALSAMTQNARPGSPAFTGSRHSAAQRVGIGSGTSDDRKIIILPCKIPPSLQRVQLWLQAKREYDHSKKCSKGQTAVTENANQDLCWQPSEADQASTSEKASAAFSAVPVEEQAAEQTHETDPSPEPPSLKTPEQNNSKQRSPSHLSKVAELFEDEDDYYRAYSSPDSPLISPWQQPASPNTRQWEPNEENKDVAEPTPDVNRKTTDDFPSPTQSSISPNTGQSDEQLLENSPLQSKAGAAENSLSVLHSTPMAHRSRKDGIPEVLYCTPIQMEPRQQKISQRKASNSDSLRRVLLTTQLKNQFAVQSSRKSTSQIEGPTLNNSYGFKVSQQNLQEAKALHEVQYLVLMSMELHARTRRDLEPDPEFDPICALFYCISSDAVLPETNKTEIIGAIVIDKNHINSNRGTPSELRAQAPLLVRSGVTGLQVSYVNDEKELFQELVRHVRRYDPDILLGYEVQMHSWSYLFQRAAALEVDLCQMVSRVPDENKENRFAPERDEFGATTMSEINLVGRIVLNVWRMMRSEVTLNNYTFENVAFHILRQRFPLFSFRVLSDWFDNKTDLYRWKMIDHYICRVRGNLKLLEQLDMIGRTSELARLFGILFYHVLTRGSQYRVESMMLRFAKPMNYIAITPSVQQRSRMRAPQCIPLVMEPESRFYSNSVLVLDFQSLYPSIIIAYNYCYSTCLGNIDYLGKEEEFKFGCTFQRVPPELLHQLWNDITISPNGVAFVKPSVRKGVLPSMLDEILKTRIMVKQTMKDNKKDKALTKLLHARQMGLKLIANFTCGYTAASFSGRMPCVEIGDSIVLKARETLERAIKLVNETKKWGARVVYGDTDSMFVLLKGATKEQAFRIGEEIADAVTATNPKPVKLKFEKVYLPCVLQSKKRYVGYMYESLDQKDPVFDAKGIETVRRDSCSAVSKILERSIKLLFETRDVSQIKQYVQRQCTKILEGKASMQDLTFAKEYRGSAAYHPGACVPALELTRRMLSYDRRSEPRVGERVPYVIVYGMPGLPLIQLVRRPIEVLQDPSLRLNATYYITKQILPPLNRIFSLIGVDVFSWYHELPRVQKVLSTARSEPDARKGTISQYFTTLHCPVCDQLTQLGICSKCRSNPQQVTVILHQEIREWEWKQAQLLKICRSCTGCVDKQVQCISLDCPVLYKLFAVSRDLTKAPYLRQLLDQF
ncbi:DNA polymerase zeta catalytic subunit [Pristis pectinata]|uniref:DNA polymerase zeta catalytic subunit n=1 Tax=Pristis pectinata TaxID=685728 RepID=UPI00223CA9D8|nr:DNA polymerase zeta catalytic subunit [Pristis pectinata]